MYDKERDSLEETPQCDVDDILCQFEILRAYRGLKENLGKENVLALFPELEGISERIAGEISTHQGKLREAIKKCGGLTEDEITEGIEQLKEAEE